MGKVEQCIRDPDPSSNKLRELLNSRFLLHLDVNRRPRRRQNKAAHRSL